MSAQLRFCPDCSNLLSPSENRSERRLYFKCRSCPFEEADSWNPVVHRHDVHFRQKEQLRINPDVVHDPTLSRTNVYDCDRCGGHDAVFWQLPESQIEDAMGLIFVCVSCGNWRIESGPQISSS